MRQGRRRSRQTNREAVKYPLRDRDIKIREAHLKKNRVKCREIDTKRLREGQRQTDTE